MKGVGLYLFARYILKNLMAKELEFGLKINLIVQRVIVMSWLPVGEKPEQEKQHRDFKCCHFCTWLCLRHLTAAFQATFFKPIYRFLMMPFFKPIYNNIFKLCVHFITMYHSQIIPTVISWPVSQNMSRSSFQDSSKMSLPDSFTQKYSIRKFGKSKTEKYNEVICFSTQLSNKTGLH